MPKTKVVFFKDVDGSVPLLQWLDELPLTVQDKCIVRIELLRESGYELRRPHAGTLRDGIHELRVRSGTVQYRILYFFHGSLAVLSHGLTKEAKVPSVEIERAVKRKLIFAKNPEAHTYEEPSNGSG